MNIKSVKTVAREHRPEGGRDRDPTLGIEPAGEIGKKPVKPVHSPLHKHGIFAAVPVESPVTAPAVPRRLERGADMIGITWENLGVNGIAAPSPAAIGENRSARRPSCAPLVCQSTNAVRRTGIIAGKGRSRTGASPTVLRRRYRGPCVQRTVRHQQAALRRGAVHQIKHQRMQE
jgi:hypothetical protein